MAAHLDDPAARYLLRLEWKALAEALRAAGAQRRFHVAQALAFRARRLSSSTAAARLEREQMRHEGLAAYTGIALSGDPVRLALAELEHGAGRPTLSRSFSYVSGPAWGLLLDALNPAWRDEIRQSGDIPDAASIAAAPTPLPDRYGGTAVLLEETLRGMKRQAELAAALYATASIRALRLPLAKMSMEFDPDRVLAAPDGSSVYHRITLRDDWGRIRVDQAGLRITPDFKAAYAPWPLPADALALFEGWRVEVEPGGGARVVDN